MAFAVLQCRLVNACTRQCAPYRMGELCHAAHKRDRKCCKACLGGASQDHSTSHAACMPSYLSGSPCSRSHFTAPILRCADRQMQTMRASLERPSNSGVTLPANPQGGRKLALRAPDTACEVETIKYQLHWHAQPCMGVRGRGHCRCAGAMQGCQLLLRGCQPPRNRPGAVCEHAWQARLHARQMRRRGVCTSE